MGNSSCLCGCRITKYVRQLRWLELGNCRDSRPHSGVARRRNEKVNFQRFFLLTFSYPYTARFISLFLVFFLPSQSAERLLSINAIILNISFVARHQSSSLVGF